MQTLKYVLLAIEKMSFFHSSQDKFSENPIEIYNNETTFT